MARFVDVDYDLLVPGGHAVVFCSFLQFPDWYNQFLSVTEDIEEVDNEDPSNTTTVEKQVFTVE